MSIVLSDTFAELVTDHNVIAAIIADLGTASAITISGGNINGVALGSVTPVSGTFNNLLVNSTLNVSTASLIIANDQISGNSIDGGIISSVMIELSAEPTQSYHATSKLYVDTGLTSKLNASVVSSFGATLVGSVNASAARSVLGLGSLATQNTGSFFQVSNNLSEISSASTARTNLGLGSLATLSSVDNTNWSGAPLSGGNGGTGNQFMQFSGPASTLKTYTLPNQTGTVVLNNVTVNRTRQQYFGTVGLTEQATISWNVDTAQTSTITLTANRIMANPTNIQAGGEYVLFVKQDATGGRILNFQNAYIFLDGGSPTIATEPNQVTVFKFISDGTVLYQVGGTAISFEPVGTVKAFAGTVIPNKHFLCDGSFLSRSVNQKLFSVIGTTYGAGDGVNTFQLPDLRGEFIRGFDSTRGVDPARVFGSGQLSQDKGLRITNNLTISGTYYTDRSVPDDGSYDSQPYITGTNGGGIIWMNFARHNREVRPRNVSMNYIIYAG